jgi:hypothetical protein
MLAGAVAILSAFRSRFCLDGQITQWLVQPPLQKYFRFPLPQITSPSFVIPPSQGVTSVSRITTPAVLKQRGRQLRRPRHLSAFAADYFGQPPPK